MHRGPVARGPVPRDRRLHRATVARGPVPRDRRLHQDPVARGPVPRDLQKSLLLFLQFHVRSMAFGVTLRLLLDRLLESHLKVYIGLVRQAD